MSCGCPVLVVDKAVCCEYTVKERDGNEPSLQAENVITARKDREATMSGLEGTSSREGSTDRERSSSRRASPEPTNLELNLARQQAEAGRELLARQQGGQAEEVIYYQNWMPREQRQAPDQTSQWEINQEQAGQRKRSEQATQRGNSSRVEQRSRVREKSQTGRGTYK